MVPVSSIAQIQAQSNGFTARNALRDWNSVPVLVEGKYGGFATSEEFLCHV
jgi:hypothetical protein